MIKVGLWLNKKTKNQYFVIGTILNTTNAENGQIMVKYMDLEGNEYCREIAEFKEKFTKQ